MPVLKEIMPLPEGLVGILPWDWSAWLAGVTLPAVAVGVAAGLLAAAAWHDLQTRLIPDAISLALAIGGVAYRAQLGLIDFAFSAITSLLLFFLLFAAFNRGVVGGGDVKLMVATALWLSPPDCYVFLAVTAVLGGGLAMLHLFLRAVLGSSAQPKAQQTPALAWWRAELGRIRSGCPLPYGVAIAGGGCFALLTSLGG